MTAKARDGEATRATILATARSQFGAHGFERTTIRSIASAAGVDPALVMHYFGSKAKLFAAASRFDIEFPDLAGVAPDRVADVLLPMFVGVWGPHGPFLPLLRAAATNPAAADALLEVFVDRVTPALAAVVARSRCRACRVGGLATARRRGGALHPRRPAVGRHGRRDAHRMAAAGARPLPVESRTRATQVADYARLRNAGCANFLVCQFRPGGGTACCKRSPGWPSSRHGGSSSARCCSWSPPPSSVCRSPSSLSNGGFRDPTSQSWHASQLLSDKFGHGDMQLIVAVTSDAGVHSAAARSRGARHRRAAAGVARMSHRCSRRGPRPPRRRRRWSARTARPG